MARVLIKDALDIIKEFEGLKLKAYLDPVGIPTIGYGTIRYPNGSVVKLGDTITETKALEFLLFECNKSIEALEKAIKVPVNDNMFGALVSWTYNVGIGAMGSSTLIKELNKGNYSKAADELLRWNKGTVNGAKVVLNGLTRRRNAERELFLEPSQKPEKTVEDAVDSTPSWFEPFKKLIEQIIEFLFGKSEPKIEPQSDYKFAHDFLIADGVKEKHVLKFINHWEKKTKANYSYFFNYDKHCSEHRFYVFNKKSGVVSKYKSTHGIGGDKNGTGYSTSFSNIAGSKQSTLGLTMCAETYLGKNGRSLRLDGLDSTNSKMRERLIVIHGANYATSCGRSEGCPCIHHDYAQTVIDQLKLGSPGYHYHKSMI